MKALLPVVALAVALAWVATHLSVQTAPTVCPHCQQDIASATYFGLIELDCDGQWDSPVYSGGAGAQCSDELANVNRLPHLDGVDQGKNQIVVRLTFYLSGGPGKFPVVVRFNRRGAYEGTA